MHQQLPRDCIQRSDQRIAAFAALMKSLLLELQATGGVNTGPLIQTGRECIAAWCERSGVAEAECRAALHEMQALAGESLIWH